VDYRVCRLAGIVFGNPSVALSLVVPRRGSSGSHFTAVPTGTEHHRRVPWTTTPPLKQKRCPCARWRHKGESKFPKAADLRSAIKHLLHLGGNGAQYEINATRYRRPKYHYQRWEICWDDHKGRAEAGLESFACMMEVLEGF